MSGFKGISSGLGTAIASKGLEAATRGDLQVFKVVLEELTVFFACTVMFQRFIGCFQGPHQQIVCYQAK